MLKKQHILNMVMCLRNKALLKGISTFSITNHCFSYIDYKEFY